jgi:Protein of unknown function (DUF3987)/Bifunctional DNA primase/polymerase, N-terminal
VEDTTIYNSATQHEKTLEAANKLAAKKGIPVFPCKMNKSPLTLRGFKDATTDPKDISQMWEMYRNVSCIGAPTGEASDLLVIDVDVDDGKQGEESLAHLEEIYEPLPTRRKVRTGGGGIQCYFRYPKGYGRIGNLTNLLPGIDVRGEGGYIILPPSVSHKGPYTWEEKGKRGYAPEWLIDLILTPPSKDGRDGGMDSFMGEDGTVVIPDGARDDTLFRLTCSLIGKGFPLPAIIAAIEETDRQCSESPGGDSRDDRAAEAIVRSAYQRYEAGKLWISSKGTDELPAFPVDAMPVKTRAFIRETAKALDCPLDLVGVPVLGALSASIGNSRRVRMKRDWSPSPSLYLAAVSPSGSGKSPAQSAALAPVRKKQRDQRELYEECKRDYERAQREYDALLKKEKPTRETPRKPYFPRTWVDDTTVEALGTRFNENWRGLYLIQDELSGWIAGMNQYKGGKGNDRQKYISIWGGQTVAIDRKSSDEPEIVERPFLTICGGIQPSRLKDLADSREDGFFERFLVAYPEESVAHPGLDDEISEEAKKSYHNLIRKLYNLETAEEGTPDTVPLTREAKRAFEEYSDSLADEQEFGALTEGMRATIPKLREYLARISLIMAVCRIQETDRSDRSDSFPNIFDVSAEVVPEEVLPEDVERASTLIWYFMEHLKKVHSRVDRYDTASIVASELVSHLHTKDGLSDTKSASEWQKTLSSAPDTPEATSILLWKIAQKREDMSLHRNRPGHGRGITIKLEEGVGGVGGVGADTSNGHHPNNGEEV